MINLHTNHGVISIELDAAKAPVTAENFLGYVKAGHYDNTIFHRVIDGFMIQGGGFEPGMKQKATGAPIKNEADNIVPLVDEVEAALKGRFDYEVLVIDDGSCRCC